MDREGLGMDREWIGNISELIEGGGLQQQLQLELELDPDGSRTGAGVRREQDLLGYAAIIRAKTVSVSHRPEVPD